MGQQGFLINTEDCIGCKACELACKDLHSFDIGPRTRRVYEVCGGDWSVDDVTGVCVPSNVFGEVYSDDGNGCMSAHVP